MTINKTQTKKLIKALEENGVFDKRMYIGKSGAGLWYIGLEHKFVAGFPDNVYSTADDAIQACVGGARPEVIYVSPNKIHQEG